MYTFFIIGVFEAYFLAIILFLKKNKHCADNILAFYFLLNGTTILFIFFEAISIKSGFNSPRLMALAPPLVLLHGFALWLYVSSVTNLKFKLKLSHILHVIPFIIMEIYFCKTYYFATNERIIQLYTNELFKEMFGYKFFVLLVMVSVLFYLGWSLLLTFRFRKKMHKINIKIHKIDLKWLNFLLITALILYGTTVITNSMDLVFSVMSFKNFQAIANIIGSFFVLLLGLYGHRQGNVFSDAFDNRDPIIDSVLIQQDNVKEKNKDLELAEKLLNLMKTKKPYINAELNVSTLSKMLSVSSYYLSEIINNTLKMNFMDFVNSYRVNEFKEKLNCKEYEKHTLLSVAYDSGFNSKATFNRVFMKKLNMTPSQYKQMVSKN